MRFRTCLLSETIVNSLPKRRYEEVIEVEERIQLVLDGVSLKGVPTVEGVSGESVEIVRPLDEDSLSKELKVRDTMNVNLKTVSCSLDFVAESRRCRCFWPRGYEVLQLYFCIRTSIRGMKRFFLFFPPLCFTCSLCQD